MTRSLVNYLQNPGADGPALGESIVSLIQDTDFVAISASFRASLFPERGPMPNYFTAAIANPGLPTTVDCYGMLKTCNPGEALFYGARRVENLVRYSEHLSRTADGIWVTVNGAAIAPVTDPRRPGKSGDMTAWKLSRAAQVNSILRMNRPLQRHHGVGGLDLLLPVPHFLGVNLRMSDTNPVASAEPRIYTPGGPVHITKVIAIDGEMRTYGLTFTPAAPRRITALSWAGGVLTVTCPSHGYASGTNIRLSGSLPATFDVNAAVASVPNADTFTLPMAANPGALVVAGWTQMQYVFGIAPGSWASTALGDIEIEKPYVSEMLGYPAGMVPEYVPRHRYPQRKYWYGAAVDGVRWFDTQAGWTYDAASGLVSEATGEKLATCRGVTTYGYTENRIERRHAEAFSEWSRSDASMAVADAVLAAPTGDIEASRVSEGTHSGRHYVELPAGQLTLATVGGDLVSSITCYLATPGGGAGGDWAVISFTDRDGIEQHGYFDLAAGATGSRTVGFLYLNIEPLGTIDGLTYYRAHVSALHGAGSETPILRIGLAAGDGVLSYQGDGARHIAVWGASFVGGTSSRPVAAPYGRRHWNERAALSGAAVTFTASGLFGTQMLSASSTCTPYYSFYQPGRVSWSASLYFRCEPVQTIAEATDTGLGFVALDRFGIVIRPNFGTSDQPGHMTKVAFDHYNGEVVKHYLFEPGRTYAVGDTVLPSDTQVNNANAAKLWTVTTGGVSGAEPDWPPVSSLPSASVTSGEVTFQVTHDNGALGNFEPYSGAQIQPPAGFMPEMTAAFFFDPQDYGAFVNGQEAARQTWPRPMNPERGYALRSPVSTVVLGGLGADDAIDPTTVAAHAGSNLSGMMPQHTSFHRDVVIWKVAKTPAYLAALTAGA